MFSLFVSHQVEDQSDGVFSLSSDRFLEHTDRSIAEVLRGLSNEAIECLSSWPCLLMQEGRAEEPVYLREVTDVRVSVQGIALVTGAAPAELQLINDDLWRMREALDIGQWEFNRNHWSVKDRDLFAVLRDNGFTLDDEFVARFVPQPLPTVARELLLRARDAVSSWGHTEIDDLLLEAGVDGLHPDREGQSRRDRANAIIRYVLDNPNATTEENALLSLFVARKAGVLEDAAGTDVAASQAPAAPAPTTAAAEVVTTPQPEGLAERGPDDIRRSNRVFVVHGQDETIREDVVSFLRDQGLEAVVLHEQPNMGQHLLTKFIREAELATFAVVLLTDDDTGGRRGEAVASRARQNVILELGYFLSHLGQENVCVLKTPGLETPSDFDGIVYISMENDARWKDELRRELIAAKMPVVD